jgi:hypothetical protein
MFFFFPAAIAGSWSAPQIPTTNEATKERVAHMLLFEFFYNLFLLCVPVTISNKD